VRRPSSGSRTRLTTRSHVSLDIDLGPDVGEASGPQNLGATMNPAAFFMLGIITTLVVVAFGYGLFGRD
jgi:hypothetical protein